jgi:hypothetical protein
MKRKNARIRRVAAQQSQASIAVFSAKRWKRHLTLIVAADTPDVRVRLTRKIDAGLDSMWHKGKNINDGGSRRPKSSQHSASCERAGGQKPKGYLDELSQVRGEGLDANCEESPCV